MELTTLYKQYRAAKLAADQAAKEVAQYSYILEKIGILDSLDGLNSRSEDFEKNIKSIEEQLQTVQQAGENALNGEDPVGNTIEAGKAAKDAYGTVSGYVDDPESFISGVLTVFKKDAINGISTYMVNTVAKSCVMKQLSVAGGGQDPLCGKTWDFGYEYVKDCLVPE